MGGHEISEFTFVDDPIGVEITCDLKKIFLTHEI